MEVSFNGAKGETVELMRRWLNSLDQSSDLGFVPPHTYGILCKSKDDTLFPLLCCNAGALPDGMEIRDELGHSVRNVAYVSPVFSSVALDSAMYREPFQYRCERVSDLPDNVRESLENICRFFQAKESIEKSNSGDFLEKLESLTKYRLRDKPIGAIYWSGINLIVNLAILADAKTGYAISDENHKEPLWAIANSVTQFHQTIENRIDSLRKISPSDEDFDTRNERIEALDALKATLSKLSTLDIASLADGGSEFLPATKSAPLDKLSPQERFLRDLWSLFCGYGFYPSIGRVHCIGKRLIETLNDPKTSILTRSNLMLDYKRLLKETITEMENDLEDDHPDKSDRISKLERLLTDLADLKAL